VEALKSVVLALALLERHVSVETAVALSRLEEEYQVIKCQIRLLIEQKSPTWKV
jgi:chaperone required for assembly of F1-ATPase